MSGGARQARAITREAALDLWRAGQTAAEIADALSAAGEAAGVGPDDALGPQEVKALVLAARKAGDGRAVRHPQGPKRRWSGEGIAMLRALWADGLTCSQIARALNTADPALRGPHAVTRNAVIGKAFRLGLARRASPALRASRASSVPPGPVEGLRAAAGSPGERHASGQAQKATAAGGIGDRPRPGAAGISSRPRLTPDSGANASGVTLLDRTPQQCPFPLGEPEGAQTLMCGAEKGAADPYCWRHLRVVYAAPPPTWSAERRARFYALPRPTTATAPAADAPATAAPDGAARSDRAA